MKGKNVIAYADLIRYLDGELDDRARAEVDARVATEPEVAERVRVLRLRTSRLSGLLGAVDPTETEVEASARAMALAAAREPGPPGGAAGPGHAPAWYRSPPLLRAAAIAGATIAAALLVEPVRAWVVEQVRAVAEAVGLRESVPAGSPAPAPLGPAVRYSFEWVAASFEVEASAAGGTLVLRRGATGRAGVESTDEGLQVVVTPAGIRLGGGGEGAEHTLLLPPSVRELVLVRDGSTSTYALPAGEAELRVPLR